MRKIYSLVLIAAALLVGTNVWATVRVVASTDPAVFNEAWSKAQDGDTIRLEANITANNQYWLGTDSMAYAQATTDLPLTLTLDLYGNTLTASSSHEYLFILTHGTLRVISTNGHGTIVQPNGAKCSELFFVTGSTLKDCDPSLANSATNPYFVHLDIAQEVTVDASLKQTALTITKIDNITDGIKAGGYDNTANPQIKVGRPKYNTKLYYVGVPRHTANGVRIDIWGTLLGEKYGVKVDGYLRGPREFLVKTANGKYIKRPQEIIDQTNIPQKRAESEIYFGHPAGTYYYPTTASVPYTTTKYPIDSADVNYAPYIYVHGGSQIIASADGYQTGTKTESSPAIYCSGYARWLIQGYCSGSVGVIVKSGDVVVDGATVTSTWTDSHADAEATTSGSTAQGSAIVVQSADGWSGDVSMTITGTSEITSTTGYALEETVTAVAEGAKVENITISGGTFVGGSEGAIAVTTTVGDDYVTTVHSGNIEGAIQNLTDGQTMPINDIMTEDSHKTTVTDPETGKTTIVVSQGTQPTATDDPEATIKSVYEAWVQTGEGPAPSVKWTKGSETLDEDITLTELEINESSAQTLTIFAGKTLSVGRVVLGPQAQIIVQPGARFLVTGNDGIYSLKDENIVIQANASDQAIFVIGKDVKSNRQPHATVQYVLSETSPSTTQARWTRFTSPLVKVKAAPTVTPTAATYVKCLNLETGSWDNLAHWTDLKPFSACAITKTTSGNVTYSFKGMTMGNVVDSIRVQSGMWSYYGNSFTAPISAKALVNKFYESHEADATIYYWTLGSQGYHSANKASFEIFGVEEESDINIPMMGFFAIRNKVAAGTHLDIDYGKTIYGYAVDPTNADYNIPSSAPARMNSTTSGKVRMTLTSETGSEDKVYLLEDASKYSTDYDNGYDAVKLMNNDLNIYVAEEEMNYAMLATDNLLGAVITIQTSEDLNYTLTFDKVAGEEYALRDNQTNTVVMINEGATYNFTAQPNATLDGRFQIVGRQEMPTAAETVEETVDAPKAIYTIMGQYVGETADWNSLPAGVYVVDGVKIVK